MANETPQERVVRMIKIVITKHVIQEFLQGEMTEIELRESLESIRTTPIPDELVEFVRLAEAADTPTMDIGASLN